MSMDETNTDAAISFPKPNLPLKLKLMLEL
jgi:hypothetical protein